MEKISETIVEALPTPATGNKLHYFSGARLQGKECPVGFAVRVTANGAKAFVWFHRVDGKAHLETLGRHGDDFSVLDAIIKAKKRVDEISKGTADPRPARTRRSQEKAKPVELTVSGLLDVWMTRYVEGQLRSEKLVRQAINRLVKPKIGDKGIYELKRSMVARMLDEIADENGEVMADRTLSYVRKAFNWYEVHGHDDDFKSPVVRGMQRVKASDRARDHILDDNEIRALWKATAGTTKPFKPMLRFILLTACRRMEAAGMTRSEITEGVDAHTLLPFRVWTIPAARSKGKTDVVLPLSQAAQDILASMTIKGEVEYIFTRRTRPLGGFTQLKSQIDEQCGFDNWSLHDLRRTARSLLARAGVSNEIAEQCLGHKLPGVLGVYNRHQYLEEKRDAFERLAATVDGIISAGTL